MKLRALVGALGALLLSVPGAGVAAPPCGRTLPVVALVQRGPTCALAAVVVMAARALGATMDLELAGYDGELKGGRCTERAVAEDPSMAEARTLLEAVRRAFAPR